MSQVICGIDASLTGTAVCIGDRVRWEVKRFPSKPNGDAVCGRISRIESVVTQVVSFLEMHKPAAIFLENYAFGSKFGRETLGELGGVLRWHLLDFTPDTLFEVAPQCLKKFITGKGAGQKDQVQAHIQRQWGEIFPTNDHADAFALYRLGLCACGLAPMTNQAQREAVEKVVGKELLSFAPADVAGAPF